VPSRRPSRLVAAAVLGVMVCMAGAGLAFALLTQRERRAHDTGLIKKPKRSPVAVAEPEPVAGPVAPDKLEALGYLAPETGLVIGVHVADLLAVPEGRQLLESPFQVGKGEIKLNVFVGSMGLRLVDLDHLVIGMKLDDPLIPRSHLIAHTREPIDPEQLRARLNGQRLAGTGKRVIYRYAPAGRQVPLAMFCPDNRTVVVSFLAPHLELIPLKPDPDLGQLPEDLRGLLRERKEPGSQLWAVARAEDWSRTSLRRLLERMKKEDAARLAGVRTFGVWVQLDRAVTVKAAFRCKDDAAARGLDEFFHTPPRNSPSLKTALDGPWLNVQLRTDRATAQQALGL
jgi:hypothetical protein